MSAGSSSSTSGSSSQNSRSAATFTAAPSPSALPSSPRSPRQPPSQHPSPAQSSMFSTAPPSPDISYSPGNASASLVGQLLRPSQIGGGATPYGLIISAGSGGGRAGPSPQVLGSPRGEAPTSGGGRSGFKGEAAVAALASPTEGSGETLASSESTEMSTTPLISGYVDLRLVYSINYLHVYRAKTVATDKHVTLKLCAVNHLDSLARLRFEWKMLVEFPTPSSRASYHSQSSSGDGRNNASHSSAANALATHPSIVRPYTWEYLTDGGMALIYSDEPRHLTVREVFLPDVQPFVLRTSGARPPSEVVSPGAPHVKPRTASDLIKILSVFSSVVRVLDVAHRAGITHNNINTFSILVTTDKKNQIHGHLSGWHLASRLEREELGRMAGGAMLRGENPAPLQYIAPECTGRMNRSVDYRADFYSLGVALYELVVGFLPFLSTEPLELIHQHIAQRPKLPTEVNGSIPVAISSVIMKLLEKNAEDRYQTASGLNADLEWLIQSLSEGSSLDSINVGELDTTSQFVITEKLYGREAAVNSLKSAYENCLRKGGCTMVMVQGPSGVGKSRLVNEIQRPVVENKTYFTTGKFDQYKRGLSFFTLVQTLQDLIRQVLSEPVASLARWRTNTIRALDGDVAVLIDVIPELKLLLGPEYQIEPLANIGPAERESRFRDAFARLLAIFGRKGLVLFLDDLQWCSASEFMLIAGVAEEVNRRIRDWEVSGTVGQPGVMVTRGNSTRGYSRSNDGNDDGDSSNGEVNGKSHKKQSTEPLDPGILIIGAYRDSEVDEEHPLLGMLQSLKEMSVPVIDIDLEPLDSDSVRRIIGDTLHRDPEAGKVRDDPEMQTLVELVCSKTKGNPFFVVQLLKSLHRGGHITFDFSAKNGGQWRFNLTSIEAEDLPPTVVDLLVKQMLKLSEATRTVMMVAACIGTERIGLTTLATASGKRVEEAASDLWGALDAGLILPTSGNYRVPLTLESDMDPHHSNDMMDIDRMEISSPPPPPPDTESRSYFPTKFPRSTEPEEEVTYRFLHDRVQQAAYTLIPEGERAGVHRMIGMRLLENAKETDMEDGGLMYEIVNQLNHQLSPLEPAEARVLMELNLRAGKKAMGTTAFSIALGYLLVAKKLLEAAEAKEEDLTTKNALKRQSTWENVPATGAAASVVAAVQEKSLEDLGTEIMLALTEAYFANVNYEQSITIAEQTLPRCANSQKDQVRCLMLKMNCLLAQGKLSETIETGLEGLRVLNWEVPLNDDAATTHAEMMRPRIFLDVQQIKHIAKLHELKDEKMLLLQDVISILLLPVYMARPALLAAVCFTSVAISLEYGISLQGAYPMLMTGVILGDECTHESLIRSYAFGRLAISLIEKSKVRHALAPAIYEVYAGHIGIFHQSMADVLRYLQLAVQTGMAVFNVDYTVFALAEIPAFSMMSGENLTTVHSKMVTTKPTIEQFKQESGIWWLAMPLQFCLNLRGLGNPDPLCFEGEELGDARDLARITNSESLSHIYLYHMYRLIMATIFGAHELAVDIATYCCEPLLTAVRGTGFAAWSGFYSSISFLERYQHLTDQQKEMLARSMREYREWSARAKATWLHKSVLLEAEMMRVTDAGQQLEILDRFDYAVSLANKSGFTHDAALINERCGLWLRGFSKRRAAPYLREAFRGWSSWGAVNKAADLRKQFPDDILFKENRPAAPARESTSETVVSQNPVAASPRHSPRSSRIGMDYLYDPSNAALSFSSSRDLLLPDAHDIDDTTSHSSSARNNESSSLGSELDFRTVLKASLVISEGIHLEEVIVSLMKSVLQTAGADYGVLILKEDHELHIETVGLIDQVSILEHELLHTRPDLVPTSVINLVASLGEQILRDGEDTKFDMTYGRDPYYQTRQAKSVLCMPIQNQLKTMGVLYLENKLVNHAFTRQRQELLNLLCTQAAVTIDKARLYRQMELAKKAAEEATAEKSSFLANMSHEIRTPFNALLSCSIFLLDTPLSEQQREYVETIRNSAVLTLQIIDGILDFSKIEHGAIDLQCSPFSLRDCIESALQLVAEPAATKDLELAYRNCCSNIDQILGDITRFRQCVINLIGNAVKFTQEGHILVTTKANKLPDDEKLWEIQVSVTDTGIGIPKTAFDRLFRAFSQVDASTRRTYGGTGLGLAISKKLAQMMSGDIWFESEEGVGTTFHFTIRAEITPKVWTKNPQLVGKNAIVADTHPISGSILADELEVEGLNVVRTSTIVSTLQALKSRKRGTFDVVLIDLSVDESYQIFEEVKKCDPNLRVVLMSRFGATIPPESVSDKISLTFVRPAPRARYVQACVDAMDPNLKKQSLMPKTSEAELMKSLGRQHPLNILLAEDNPLNTRVALQHLKRMGYSAKHAKDGIEVLEMCEVAAEAGAMFDVVLMDIQMPRADGIETSRELHRRYKDDERPTIIALTANATASDREKCHQAGMSTHIAKPILPNDLMAALLSCAPLIKKTPVARTW